MVLSKTTCRECGAYPVFVDNETGEIWDDQDAAEYHVHHNTGLYQEPDDIDLHRADDDGMGFGVPTNGFGFDTGSSDDSTGFDGFGGGGDFGGGGGGSDF